MFSKPFAGDPALDQLIIKVKSHKTKRCTLNSNLGIILCRSNPSLVDLNNKRYKTKQQQTTVRKTSLLLKLQSVLNTVKKREWVYSATRKHLKQFLLCHEFR